MEKYYVTTPIFYPSGDPHVGHAYCAIAADALARYKRLRGFDVMLLTGTDEHGQKIQNNAEKINMSPMKYVDEIAAKFKKLWEVLGISYDRFMRTTDSYHVESVKKIFKKLYEKGEIYKGKYEGWYCVPCESFFTDSKIVDGKCPDCGREVSYHSEEAYFFKLSGYEKKLLDFYRDNTNFISPQSRMNEMIRFVEAGLEDLCVSRTSFSWGIQVDFDEKHVVYVWLDALTNYITALGYENNTFEGFERFWPVDVHIVGKEIVRFHAVIWPAILMALGLSIPKKIFGHGWLLFGGEKMSKSKGNVVDPFELCEIYGADAIRYFLLREVPFGSDGTFGDLSLLDRVNSDLTNDLGNLLSRVSAIAIRFGADFSSCEVSKDDENLVNFALSLQKTCEKCYDELKFSSALAKIWELVGICNKYIDLSAPWNLAKDPAKHARLATVLYNVFESLRIISVLILPIMPSTAEKIRLQIGAKKEICTWESISVWGLLKPVITKGKQLFPRIDAEKKEDHEKTEKSAENLISINDFTKINLVVAKILECVHIQKSEKLFKLTINTGVETRTIVSGISKFYSPEQLIGRNVIIVNNLAPARLCGVESRGMLLAAENGDEISVIFADGIEPGSKIR